ncbi:MAG: hypothetical protein KatS3mg109_0079 [Pirellulaceae bacterium]|nr:MAG: hypothetical protein KatS3mg109_0079 [Pirellulaceae bacterium]
MGRRLCNQALLAIKNDLSPRKFTKTRVFPIVEKIAESIELPQIDGAVAAISVAPGIDHSIWNGAGCRLNRVGYHPDGYLFECLVPLEAVFDDEEVCLTLRIDCTDEARAAGVDVERIVELGLQSSWPSLRTCYLVPWSLEFDQEKSGKVEQLLRERVEETMGELESDYLKSVTLPFPGQSAAIARASAGRLADVLRKLTDGDGMGVYMPGLGSDALYRCSWVYVRCITHGRGQFDELDGTRFLVELGLEYQLKVRPSEVSVLYPFMFAMIVPDPQDEDTWRCEFQPALTERVWADRGIDVEADFYEANRNF